MSAVHLLLQGNPDQCTSPDKQTKKITMAHLRMGDDCTYGFRSNNVSEGVSVPKAAQNTRNKYTYHYRNTVALRALLLPRRICKNVGMVIPSAPIVSMMRFTHNSCTGARGGSFCVTAAINTRRTATMFTVSWNCKNFRMLSGMNTPQNGLAAKRK